MIRILFVSIVFGFTCTACFCPIEEVAHEKQTLAKVEKVVYEEPYTTLMRAGRVSTFYSHPAVYRVKFVGQVEVESSDKETWERFKNAEGETVTLTYREIHRLTYYRNSNMVKRDDVRYDFVDAR